MASCLTHETNNNGVYFRMNRSDGSKYVFDQGGSAVGSAIQLPVSLWDIMFWLGKVIPCGVCRFAQESTLNAGIRRVRRNFSMMDI